MALCLSETSIFLGSLGLLKSLSISSPYQPSVSPDHRTLQVLYVFLVLAHERRRILHFSVTAHPTATWTAEQLKKCFPLGLGTPLSLARSGSKLWRRLTRQVQDMGIEQVLSAPRSPRQRAYEKHVIGTIRRECLDHVIIFGEAPLYQQIKLFAAYYHESRTHLSLTKTHRRRAYCSYPNSDELLLFRKSAASLCPDLRMFAGIVALHGVFDRRN
jgi:hypothetical protein